MSRQSRILSNAQVVARAVQSGPEARRTVLRRYLFDLLRQFVPTVGIAVGDDLIFVSTKDRTVGRSVFIHGGWEPNILPRALDLVPSSGTVFVEVGANIGTTTVPAARLVDRVVAVEPEPANLRLLRANLAANGVADRVAVVEAACSDADGRGWLTVSPVNSGDNRLGHSGDIEVPARRLDDILEEQHVDPRSIRLLWIDTQGHEPAVLAGAPDTLKVLPPLLVEFCPPMLGDRTADLVDRLNRYPVCIDMTTGNPTTPAEAAYRYREGVTDLLCTARS